MFLKFITAFIVTIFICSCQTTLKEKTSDRSYVQQAELFIADGQLPDDVVFSEIQRMDTDGKVIAFTTEACVIVWLSSDGVFLAKAGSRGQGPEEFPYSPGVIMQNNSDTWAIASNQAYHFKEMAFKKRVELPGDPGDYRLLSILMGFNTFDASDQHMVVPINPEKENPSAIAGVYDMGLNLVNVVEDPGLSPEFTELSVASERTMWRYHDNFWYGLYVYDGRILKLDDNFELVDAISIDHPFVTEFTEEFRQQNPGSRNTIPMFWSFQIYKNLIYASTQKGIFAIDPDTGEVQHIINFRIGPSFGLRDIPRPFHYFVILNDGRLILQSPALPSELFWAELPQAG